MKLLVVTDKVMDFIYSPCLADRFADVDMVLSCGDLPYYYLEYIVSVLNVPLLYVHGNHDPAVEFTWNGGKVREPGGCQNVHCRLSSNEGLTVVGLEGSIRYKPEGQFQYTDLQMWSLAFRIIPSLLFNRFIRRRQFDVLLCHSPPYGIHDGDDRTHIGFRAFLWLMKRFKPRYLLHGHRHVYNPLEVTETQYEATTVINTYPYKVLEIDTDPQ